MTVYDAAPKETVTAGSSLSVMLTVVVEVVPAVTPLGGVPKPSATVSPSSSTVSSSALKVIAFDVSPLLKVTLAGTPEKSAASAPSPGVAVIGITTVRSGSCVELDLDGDAGALRDGVRRRTEGDRDRRVVVVGDADGGRRGRAGRHAAGRCPEAERDGLAVVVDRVLVGAEGDRLRRLAAVEGDVGRYAREVGVLGPVPGRGGDRDHDRPFGVLVELHLDGDAGALRDGVRRRTEGDRDRRVVVVGDADGGRRGRAGRHAAGGRPEAERDGLAVVVDRVVVGAEGDRLRRLAAVEGDVGRYAREVGGLGRRRRAWR